MDLESRQVVRLTDEGLFSYAPTWSPDGQWIAYQSTSVDGTGEIWVMDRMGRDQRQITYTRTGFSLAPAWSPDGRWLAFVSSQAGSYGPDYGGPWAVSGPWSPSPQWPRSACL
jgi:TolB protein